MKKNKVAIVMGSKTDLKIMKEAATCLKELKIAYDIQIVSAHRTPEDMLQFAKTAAQKYQVIIAGAGGAAHLPGMIAALTTLPVIGVPINVTKLDGLDALLSVVQMPKGVPVATVAIDNATNAGILAARILGVHDQQISKKLLQLQRQQKSIVKKMNASLKRRKN
jgi:5-(carboxyamino)imidazole ribonucleotide mutase